MGREGGLKGPPLFQECHLCRLIPHRSPKRGALLTSLLPKGRKDTKNFSNLPEVTQLAEDRDRIQPTWPRARAHPLGPTPSWYTTETSKLPTEAQKTL